MTHVLDLPSDYNIHYAKPEKYGCLDCVNKEKCIDCATTYDNNRIEDTLEILGAKGSLKMNLEEGNCNLEDICNSSCSSCSIS